MRRSFVVLVALLSLVLLAGCGSDAPAEGDVSGAVLTEPYVVPDTALVDTDGEPFSLAADTDERLTLVFFGYTNCPDICQIVMSSLSSALTRLDEADREDVQVVFVTTDPARDDEAALRDYLDRFDPAFVGLTGDLDTITDIGLDLGVAVEKGEKLPSGGYEVTHSTQVIGVDAEDRAPIVWTEGTSAEEFAQDVHTLLTGEV
ncbi:SCO family protein [Nocardioides euryhalodurans]|uniref:SCO family protein n=1 Tax=Nocardioides euryhalodurans TaxID=2518370 RepID=A0A4P7GGD3_9ACTN|nr:SCO family protein [Nocardioides euryhalodurans]QBR90885.1 SCO family protein [Nocardioides euryhalodurans]